MSDNNLSSSITALVNQIKTEIPTSSAENLKRLARSIRKLGHSGDSTIDTLINTRANALVASATPSELQILSEAVNLVDDTSNPTAATNVNADVHVSDTAPASAVSGDLWWKTDELNLYIYYEDTDGAQWIQANSTVITGTIPTDVSDLTDNTSLLGSGDATAVVTKSSQSAMLAISSPSIGDMVYRSDNAKLMMYNGSGWYVMATINTTPTVSSVSQTTDSSTSAIAANGTFAMTAGSNTVVTITGADADEGSTLTYSATVTSGTQSNVLSSLTQSANVFTLAPATSGGGTITIRFDVSDSASVGNQSASFSISFVRGPFLGSISYASKSLSGATQGGGLQGCAIAIGGGSTHEGKHFYMGARFNNLSLSGYRLFQYDLTTANDLSTGSYASKSLDITSTGNWLHDFCLVNAGTKLFACAKNGSIGEWTLSTAFDISTGSFVSNESGFSGSYGIDVAFDGSKLFLSDYSTGVVTGYAMTSAFNLSTRQSADSSTFTFSGGARGIRFNTNGKKLLAIVGTTLKTASLTTAWDLSTASLDSDTIDINGQTTAGTWDAVCISAGDDKVFAFNTGNSTAYQYE